MSDIFKNIEFNTDIISSKQYEIEEGIKINDISILETDSLELPDVETICKSIDEKKDVKNKRVEILRLHPIKTNNPFINKMQEEKLAEIEVETKRIANADINLPYIQCNILTDAELQLYNFMKNNLCNIDRIEILPKVRMADIIKVDEKITTDKSPFYKIASKHIDFIICKANTLETICAVELDDFTHDTEERRKTDKFKEDALKAAGIQTVRFQFRIATIEKRDLEHLEYIINTAVAPMCPSCNKKMIPRKNKKDGLRFYACTDSKYCRHTIPIDMLGEELK